MYCSSQAFRKRAMEWHPDRHPEDTAKYSAQFQRAVKAYELICQQRGA